MVYVLYVVMMVAGVEVSKQESFATPDPERCNTYSYQMEEVYSKRLSEGYTVEFRCVMERVA